VLSDDQWDRLVVDLRETFNAAGIVGREGSLRQWRNGNLWGCRPGFASLVRVILEQQVSLASAASVYGRLISALGPVTPQAVTRIGESGLRQLGFTRQKAGYVHDIAKAIASGNLDLSAIARAEDAAARTMLLKVRGIGPWTAHVYRLMMLRRPDVWPDGDLALAEAIRRLRRLRSRPSTQRQRQIACAWEPWRAVATKILWHFYLAEVGVPRPTV
jgi:DNA-3-methyladenine glycosylase II